MSSIASRWWAGGIAAFIFVLPFVLADGWPAHVGGIIAWLLLSMLTGALLVALAHAVWEPNAKPARTVRSMTLRDIPTVTISTWTVIAVLGTLAAMVDAGFLLFTDPNYYVVMGIYTVAILVIAPIVMLIVYMGDTEDARKLRGRDARGRDLARLGAASAAQRTAWMLTARRRVRRTRLVRLALALPAGLVFALSVVNEQWAWLPTPLQSVVGVALALVAVYAGIDLIRGDPLLLIGRVNSGSFAFGTEPFSRPGPLDAVSAFVVHGAIRVITVEVQAACRIDRTGGLISEPRWRGRHELGAARRVLRGTIEGERVVLVCSGGGLAIGLLGDLVMRRPSVAV